jgi:carboxyl-terminal processing protease
MSKIINFLITFALIFSQLVFAKIDQVDTVSSTFPDLTPEPQHKQVTRVISHLLSNNHYRKKEINDSLSSEVLNMYLDKLDYNHLYFFQSDINYIEKYRYSFDDAFRYGDIEAAYDIFKIYQQRVADRLNYIFGRINQSFDYSLDEYIELDRENQPWPETIDGMDELWRKRLKYAALNLKLAGKDDEGIKETLRKRYKRIQKNMQQFQSEDVFQIFMNSFSETFDPHTNYLSPKRYDDFKIRMSQSLEGIGARLTTEDDYTVVAEIVAGGPADKNGQLVRDDKIISVAQGNNGEFVDVVGWRIDDVVQLIRGKKGTIVQLEILHTMGGAVSRPDTITIVRDKIKLEDQSAKADTLKIKHMGRNLTFGVIEIPSFYSDFEARRVGDQDYKSTTNDVRKILAEFKKQNVDGVVIDLRGNGGGFLNEAVELTGLFIDKGPVVQVKDTRGRIKVERDIETGVIYDGPLSVVVDRLSASASEIFAAAIQDYDRGIIVGSQSYGKGTVQNAIDLNKFIRAPSEQLGQLKLTVAKFYRIDGGSTQNIGVIPDISFPSRFDPQVIGENTQAFSLLWDEIPEIEHDHIYNFFEVIPQLQEQHKLRVTQKEEYVNMIKEIEEMEKKRSENSISLNEEVRQKEREKANKKKGNVEEVNEESQELDPESEEDVLRQNVKKDLLVKEGATILSDLILLQVNQISKTGDTTN